MLIAADILKKDGKAVYCDDKVANIGIFLGKLSNFDRFSIGAHRRRSMREDKEKLEVKMVIIFINQLS